MGLHSRTALILCTTQHWGVRAGVQGMDKVWGQGEHVQVIHPGGECIAGREMVRPNE